MAVYIGTSGWSYDHWVGVLYPKSASSLERLDAYARQFRTVEVNNTFYRWPKDEVFSTWRERLARRVHLLGQGVAGPDPVPQAERPGALARADGGGAVPAGGEAGRDALPAPAPFPDQPRPARRGSSPSCPSGQRAAVEFRHPTLGRARRRSRSWNATARPTAS